MAYIYKITNINTKEVVGRFDNYFDARDYCMGRGNYAIDLIEVDDEGFDVDDYFDVNDYDENYEPFDIDDDFGFDPYMGEYTYDC